MADEERTFVGAEVPNDMYRWLIQHKSTQALRTGRNVKLSDVLRDALDLYRKAVEGHGYVADVDAFVKAFVKEASNE